MARVRKNSVSKDRVLWNAALYIRLSREDGNDESYSVKNQRQRLMEYLENHMFREEMRLAGVYVDDGCTGTDSDRESFQRMLEEIDQGIVNCVIVKDLSRLSRNDWECKRYLQHLFVVKDVRFISLELPKLDSFENPDEVYEMGVSIQSMYNENHCRETSIKVRGTFNMKRGKGEFIGAFAPYGYSKDPDDRHCLLVDPPAADIVKDIFYWFVRDGMSKTGIAKKLIGMGIPCPAAYKRQNGMKYHNPTIKNKEPLWSARSITAILTNQMYLGHMVQGKQKVKSYKVHTRINIPEKEWFIVEDTHEPIIDKEIFDQARMLMQKDTRTAPGAGRLYTFSGFLRCADCGKAMGRRTSKHLVYYACKTNLTQGRCTRHSIRNDVLERAVLETIQKQVVLIDNIARLIDNINNAPAPRDVSNRLAASLRLQKQELEKISGIKTGLYLDWKNGDITREEYRRMKKEFEKKEQRLRQEITRLEEENQGMPQDAADPCFEAFRRDHNLSSLDRGMVAELIKAVHIHEGGDITIEFNFADPYKRIAELVQNSREE